MEKTVIVLGAVVEATSWWLVASRGGDVWRVVTPVLVAMGVAALVVGPPMWSPGVQAGVSLAIGAATGVALYAGTRAFIVVARPWRAFRRHSAELYKRQGDLPLAAALVLSAGVTASAEEVFWRGFAQPELERTFDPLIAAVLVWAAFVAANVPSRNLAVLAGAVVGGAAWTALGWWSGGALAPLASHVVWTALMLSFPVVSRQEVAA